MPSRKPDRQLPVWSALYRGDWENRRWKYPRFQPASPFSAALVLANWFQRSLLSRRRATHHHHKPDQNTASTIANAEDFEFHVCSPSLVFAVQAVIDFGHDD